MTRQRFLAAVVTAMAWLPPTWVWAADAADCQAAPPATVSRLQDALRLALCRSPELRSATAARSKARYLVDEAAAALRPSVGVQSTVQAAGNRGGAPADQTSSVSAPALTVSQTLYDAGASSALRRERKAQWRAEQHAVAARMRDVASDTLTRVVGLVGARRSLEATLENEQVARLSASAVRARLDAGSATRVDLLSAEATLAEAVRQRQTSESNERLYRGQLAGRLGVPSAVIASEFSTQGATAPSSALQGRDADALIETALATNPTLHERSQRRAAAAFEVDRTRASGGWSIGWSGQTGARRQWADIGASSRLHSELALTATLPLSDGGARQARIGQALASLESARADEDQQRLDVSQDVWTKWSQWRQAQDALVASQRAFDAAAASESARRAQYAAGAGTITDLLNAQSELAAQRKQLRTAQSDLTAAELALLLAVGAFDSLIDSLSGSATATP